MWLARAPCERQRVESDVGVAVHRLVSTLPRRHALLRSPLNRQGPGQAARGNCLFGSAVEFGRPRMVQPGECVMLADTAPEDDIISGTSGGLGDSSKIEEDASITNQEDTQELDESSSSVDAFSIGTDQDDGTPELQGHCSELYFDDGFANIASPPASKAVLPDGKALEACDVTPCPSQQDTTSAHGPPERSHDSEPESFGTAGTQPAEPFHGADAEAAEAEAAEGHAHAQTTVCGQAGSADSSGDWADFASHQAPLSLRSSEHPSETAAVAGDDFADFESALPLPEGGAPTATLNAQQVCAGAAPSAADDDAWGFGCFDAPPPAAVLPPTRSLAADVEGILAAWCSSFRACGSDALAEVVPACGADGENACAPTGDTWEEWLHRRAPLPAAFRDILREGAPSGSESLVLCAIHGVQAGDLDLYCHGDTLVGARFSDALGRLLQPPCETAAEAEVPWLLGPGGPAAEQERASDTEDPHEDADGASTLAALDRIQEEMEVEADSPEPWEDALWVTCVRGSMDEELEAAALARAMSLQTASPTASHKKKGFGSSILALCFESMLSDAVKLRTQC